MELGLFALVRPVTVCKDIFASLGVTRSAAQNSLFYSKLVTPRGFLKACGSLLAGVTCSTPMNISPWW